MNFFDYFQIGCIVLVVCFIAGKAIYLRTTSGINPIVIGRGKQGIWRVFEVCSFGALVLWLIEVLLRALHSRYELFPQQLGLPFLHEFPVKAFGVVLSVVGLTFFMLAFLNFGDSWRVGLDRKTPGKLVTGGIFSITRNPIYVGFDLFFMGIFLINGTWFFLIFALLAALAMHGQILREEEFLKNLYGESYTAYSAQTPRYLIW